MAAIPQGLKSMQMRSVAPLQVAPVPRLQSGVPCFISGQQRRHTTALLRGSSKQVVGNAGAFFNERNAQPSAASATPLKGPVHTYKDNMHIFNKYTEVWVPKEFKLWLATEGGEDALTAPFRMEFIQDDKLVRSQPHRSRRKEIRVTDPVRLAMSRDTSAALAGSQREELRAFGRWEGGRWVNVVQLKLKSDTNDQGEAIASPEGSNVC